MHTCPRRLEGGPLSAGENEDDYTPGHGVVGQPLGCTYCGSLPPDTFLDWIRRGGVVHGTDKRYKAYIDAPDDGPRHCKFYYQHFSKEQQAEFIELYNSRQMKLTEFGLYVLPFFCTTRPPEEGGD